MMQRKPMSRGAGFKRPEYAKGPRLAPNRKLSSAPARAPAEIEAACGLPADSTTAEHRPAPAVRRGTYASPDVGIPISVPKRPRAENAHLLRMARDKPCLIRSPICNYDPETTVACHGGGVENGKGAAYKVSDALTCWGCSACNHYTDAYAGATKAQKRAAFMLGHLSQVREWRAIAGSAITDPKDRAAAQWALDHLNAMPIGPLEAPL